MRTVTRPASSRPVSSYGYVSLNPSTGTPSSQHPHRHIQERETRTEEPPFHTQDPPMPAGRPASLPLKPAHREVSRPPTLKGTRGGGGDGSEGAKSAPCALAAEMKARHRLRCRGLGRQHALEDSGVAETRGLTGGSSRPRWDREEGDQGLTRGCLGQLTFASPDPGALTGPGCTSEPDSGCRYPGASGHAAGQCQLLLALSRAQAPGRTAPSSSRAPSTPEAPSRKATKGPEGAPGPAGRPTSALPGHGGCACQSRSQPRATRGSASSPNRFTARLESGHSPSRGLSIVEGHKAVHTFATQNRRFICKFLMMINSTEVIRGSNSCVCLLCKYNKALNFPALQSFSFLSHCDFF